MSKTRIKKFDVDWLNIKNACRATISLDDSWVSPSNEWKRKLLICRHSPIRRGRVLWRWSNIPYATSVHFCRHHIGCEKWVGTSREDRTGIKREERGQMDFVPMEMEANLDSLMNIAEKRLCMSADKTTRTYMEDLVDEIEKYDEDVAWSLVPSCVRCGGCIEGFNKCNFYDNLMKDTTLEEQQDIQKRYDIYKEHRQKVKRRNQ